MLYPQEQTAELFDKLPRELRAALFSEDNAEFIAQIAKRYKIPDEQIPAFAVLVGNILLGLLPPSTLAKVLEQELKIPAEQTVFISQEVSRLILYPVRNELAEFYKETSPTALSENDIASPSKQKTTTKKRSAVADASAIPNEMPISDDTYREIVE
ncbi:MAG: hypothetical protein NTZ42_03150 [Candidatus Gribaldobacteria bacterium]|nr:hypothetical protein [Candidatus Gribaldobacteria bacterium]